MKSYREAFYPSIDSLKIVETSAKELSPEEPKLLEWHKSYVSKFKSRIARDLDIVLNNTQVDSTVLEFGSIPLLLTTALSKLNYNVIGCDIAPERYSSTIEKTGLNVIKCDIEKEILPLGDNSFDAVVFNELFEHLRINPIFTLSEVLRVMKPGATLMLSSPNLRSLAGIKNFIFKNKAYSCAGNIYAQYEKLEELGHMGHVREYTTTEVIEFLHKIGFEVTTVVYRGGYPIKLAKLLIRAIPRLSPFVSYIANKPKTNETA